MATIEQLLELDETGWQQIAKMDKEQLKEYLKDVTKLEPPILIDKFDLENKIKQQKKANNDNDPNPIKSSKKSTSKMDKSKNMDEEFNDLMKDL